MKNRYTWSQVAQIYNSELGIEYDGMEQYLRGLYSDLKNMENEQHEKNIKTEINKNNINNIKSEYFPDFYI